MNLEKMTETEGWRAKRQKMGEIEEQPGKEGRRLHSEKHACPRREPNGCQSGVKPSPNRARWQSLLRRRTVGSSPGSLLELARCERAALESRDDNARAVHGTEARVGALERQQDPVLPAPPRVDNEAVAYTPVDAASDSNPSRGWGETRRPMDARAHSPGAASRWRCHSIDTARA